ncbi:MAG: hypothetical protein KME67_15425 [Candidatus Thiodiazotropha sp. (ex Codakia orbicularis)]|nr:hypothetical protein [Candidatus Thiodiazotropha sp. (ex Codakia orbicularis)]
MTTSLNSAVLALDTIYQRISRIDVICDVLKGMESGDINFDGDITGGVTLMTVVVESLELAMSDAFEDCTKVQAYFEDLTGEHFTRLVENARQVRMMQAEETEEVQL